MAFALLHTVKVNIQCAFFHKFAVEKCLFNLFSFQKFSGGTSPVSSDGATTARASSIVRDFHHNGNNTLNKNHLGGHNNIGYDR